MNIVNVNFLINIIRMSMSSDKKTKQLYDSIIYQQKIDIFTEIDLITPTLAINDIQKLHNILLEYTNKHSCVNNPDYNYELFNKLELTNQRIYELENRTFS